MKAIRILACVAALGVSAQPGMARPRFATLYSFQGVPDGEFPQAGLVVGKDGALYGTTFVGGTGTCSTSNQGCGAIFKLTPPSPGTGWRETTLYSFTGASDGAYPNTALVIGEHGELYGTASQGGTATACNGNGCGTIFELTPPTAPGGNWVETTVHNFSGGSDGAIPVGLARGPHGKLYGATFGGGLAGCYNNFGCGVIFSLTAPTSPGGAWTETVLFSSTGNDSPNPTGITLGQNGAIYGTTSVHTGGCFGDCGTVFELTPPSVAGAAWTQGVLHTFIASVPRTDGTLPNPGLVQSESGVIYGTTVTGTTTGECGGVGCGTVFKLTPPASPGGAWTEAVIHNFQPGLEGTSPEAGVAIGGSGRLYGTTRYRAGKGCTDFLGCGAVYELVPPASPGGAWKANLLHRFKGGDGGNSQSSLAIGKRGELYGTTEAGGSSTSCASCGTVFELKP